MSKLRRIDTHFNGQYRNDLNYNFEQIEADIMSLDGITNEMKTAYVDELKRIERESKERDDILAGTSLEAFLNSINAAKQSAYDAAANADVKSTHAQIQGDYAKEIGDYAKGQGDFAKTQGDYANEKAQYANESAGTALLEAANLSQLKVDVVDATQTANNSATNADTKATLAEQKATHAQTQGDYAKSMGEYAKAQGDLIDELVQENGSIPLSQKGTAFGVATLDENSKVPMKQMPNDIGVIGELTTTDKSSLVNAINEVDAKEVDLTPINNQISTLSLRVGDNALLQTVNKDNLVNAINEVNAKPSIHIGTVAPTKGEFWLDGNEKLNYKDGNNEWKNVAPSQKEFNTLSQNTNNHATKIASATELGHVKIGTGIAISPDGKISVTPVNDATTTQKGIVQLNDSITSTSITQAATANAVKQINDTKAGKNVSGNVNVTFTNGWSGRSSVYKDDFGVIFVEIQAYGGTKNQFTYIATLPVGYRPMSTQMDMVFFTGPNDSALYGMSVWINTEGAIQTQTAPQHLINGYVCFRSR